MVLISDAFLNIPYSDLLKESKKTILHINLQGYFTKWIDHVDHRLDEFKNVDRIIIENCFEAPYQKFWSQIYLLLRKKQINLSNVLVIDAGLDTLKNLNHLYCPTFFNYSVGALIPKPLNERTTVFLSLSRIIRPNRALLTQEYFKRNIISHGIVSCGSSIEEEDSNLISMYNQIIDPKYYDKFPVLISTEGKIDRVDASNNFNQNFLNALFNVVLESSYEHVIVGPYNKPFNGFWDRPFVTEKTIKAFRYHQIPIFGSVKGYVQYLRDFGFDVFDDIIDHSYDLETDPLQRIQLVADQVEKVCNLGLNHFKNLDLEHRFLNNADKIKQVWVQKDQEYLDKITQFVS